MFVHIEGAILNARGGHGVAMIGSENAETHTHIERVGIVLEIEEET